MSLLKVNKVSPQSGTDFTLGDSGDTFTVPSGATLTVAGTFTQTGAQTFDGGVDIDNFNINGTTITLSSGDMTLDVAGDIVLDADGGDVFVKDGGTTFGSLTNTSGNLIIKSGTTTAATFSGANVTLAGTVGSGAITSTGIVTGTAFTAGSAVLAEAELELLDGLTAGTAIASKVVTTDANIDTSGQRNLTITGELDAATLDISGAIDVAGTANLDVVDIDGAVDMASTLTVAGVLTGASLDISGNIDIDGTSNLDIVDIDGAVNIAAATTMLGTLTVGVDDTGHDFKVFGATSGAYMQWDESVDDLLLVGAARLVSPIGIFGADNNAGGTVSISSGDSGVTANSSAAELVVENNGTAGISILTFNNTTGQIYFGDGQDDDIGQVVYDHSTNDMQITTSGTERLRLEGTGPLSTGGETASDADAGGLTLDINANDGKFITCKSSDYAHGITDHLETDTGFAIAKAHASGGVSMTACNDGNNENIFNMTSIMGEANTTVSNSSSGGNFTLGVYRKANSGTGTQAVADAGNAWVMRNNNAAKLIFKGDGEIHSDTGSTTFDAYEDAQLVRAFDLSHGVGVIDSKFDKFISYNHEKLANLGLVGRDEDGTPNHFTNITGMQKLHNGAIWQQYEKHNRLLEAVYELASESVGKEKADAILEKHEIKLLN